MKYIWIFLLNLLAIENVIARGWHSNSTGPDWFNKLFIGVLAILLAYLLIKRPIRTLGVLLGVIVFPALMLLLLDPIDQNFGFPAVLVAIPVMWFAIFKFIDLVFKDDAKK